jgi:hypothetical protein
MLIVQLPLVASVAGVVGQVLVWAKSPPVAMLPIVSGSMPLLVRVMVLAELVVPTVCVPKARLVGDSCTVGAGALDAP